MTDHDTTPSRWITFADVKSVHDVTTFRYMERVKGPWYRRLARTIGALLPSRRRPPPFVPYARAQWPAERPIPGKRL